MWSTSLVAPLALATSSFAADDATAVTVAPSTTPSCTAARPTPSPGAEHDQLVPGLRPGRTSGARGTRCDEQRRTQRRGGPRPPRGSGSTTCAETTTSSANAPTIVLPKTRSPTATLRTSSATSRTSPANSLPGMNGTGTESWYSSAIKQDVGKVDRGGGHPDPRRLRLDGRRRHVLYRPRPPVGRRRGRRRRAPSDHRP